MIRRSTFVQAFVSAALTVAVAQGGARRFGRVGEFEGKPEINVHAADPWRSAIRNLALVEGSRVRCGTEDRIEIELDDAAFLRLSGDALAELSDYAQLSTGQRVTLISLDHGIAYFTGEPRAHDTLSVALPGAQITLREGSRVRLEASEQSSSISVLEGVVRFTTPQVEIDLRAGQLVRLDLASNSHFALLREIPKLPSDEWSEGRDKATAHAIAGAYVPGVGYGLSDLDHSGAWIGTPAGKVWKPVADENWRPYRDGRWEWYDEIGFTWISLDRWGWLPYHYGRWMQDASLGWVWWPDTRSNPMYKPGDAYWLRASGRIAWGPLAPGEVWTGTARPQLYAAANTTAARFTSGQREIDTATSESKGAEQAAEALSSMQFALAPPSPPLAAERFEAQRPALRTAEGVVAVISSVTPSVPGAAFRSQPEAAPVEEAAAAAPGSSAAATPPPSIQTQYEYGPVQPSPPPDPDETYYETPTAVAVVVVDPPYRREEKPLRQGQQTNQGSWPGTSSVEEHGPKRPPPETQIPERPPSGAARTHEGSENHSGEQPRKGDERIAHPRAGSQSQ